MPIVKKPAGIIIPPKPVPIKPVLALPSLQVPAKAIEPSAPRQGGIKRRTVADSIKTEVFEITGELAAVVNQIKQTYSPSVVTRANHEKVIYGRVGTGILALDLCLGGGVMRSRGSMLYGNRSAGKSTTACLIIAAVQREHPDMTAVYVDIEGTFDKAWAQKLGVDLDRLLIVEPETGEQAVDMADALVRAYETSIVVTDSIAMLTPMKEIENSAEDILPGLHARLMGNYLRRANNAMLVERHRGHYPINLFLNQFRMSIGVTFGDPRVIPGGKALEFATTHQIEISNKEQTGKALNKEAKLKEKFGAKGAEEAKAKADAANSGEDKSTAVLFNEHTFKITKDKTGGRFKEGKFKLIRDESTGLPAGYIDQSKSVLNAGLATGILSGSPQSFSHDTHGKWRGQPDFVKWLVENRDAERDIVREVVEVYRKRWGIT